MQLFQLRWTSWAAKSHMQKWKGNECRIQIHIEGLLHLDLCNPNCVMLIMNDSPLTAPGANSTPHPLLFTYFWLRQLRPGLGYNLGQASVLPRELEIRHSWSEAGFSLPQGKTNLGGSLGVKENSKCKSSSMFNSESPWDLVQCKEFVPPISPIVSFIIHSSCQYTCCFTI